MTSAVVLFAGALFASALLLFLVQPMFARMVLPLLGGSPAVWTTCMLFFQAGLLAGYAYVHVAGRWLTLQKQAILQVALLFLAFILLPFDVPTPSPETVATKPTLWLLGALTSSVGLPFFVLSTSAPLLQRWFAASQSRRSSDPYFLYAASNAGSLAALLIYPTLIEPLFGVVSQRRGWAMGFGAAAILVSACGLVIWRTDTATAPPAASTVEEHQRPTLGTRFQWLVLSFVPSGLMLAVTMFISTDVAVVPMFWIVPLALYLLTFIVAFSGGVAERAVPFARRLLPMVLLLLVLLMTRTIAGSLVVVLPLHVLVFALIALLCHVKLAQSRPPVTYLTEFYLWISVGGALGGLTNGLIAPAVFDSAAEYPLLLAAGCFALTSRPEILDAVRRPRHLLRSIAAAAFALAVLVLDSRLDVPGPLTLALLVVALLLCFSVSRQPVAFAVGVALLLGVGEFQRSRAWGHVRETDRTFFGIYRVSDDPERRFTTLFHGTTVHGRQQIGADAPEPLTYYHRRSPIGQLLSNRTAEKPLRVGVVGLGVGSLAAYAQPADRWTFYEIDPAVERLARDERYFRYLARCGNACDVQIGDARLSLERASASVETYDLLVLDAFSSDAIPLHLLTREAVTTYLARLTPDGLLAFHITNRHVNLTPALARIARELNVHSVQRRDALPPGHPLGYTPSQWLVMSRSAESLERATRGDDWVTVVAEAGEPWTDDFSNVWTAIMWR